MIVHSDAPANAEPPAAALAEAEITAVDTFYCRNHGAIPDIAADDWRLDITGAVARPVTLSYRQLTTDFAAHEVTATLECAGNRRAELLRARPIAGREPWGPGAVSTARWRGARLADVLHAAGVDEAPGWHTAFSAPDVATGPARPEPFGSSIPLAKALSGEVLLAWQMNGAALPRLHGGPVRVVVPGFIGARSVKWVDGVTVQPLPSQNYFQAVDYRLVAADREPAPDVGIPLSTLPLSCGILVPADRAAVTRGPLEIRGYALAADCRRIGRVEVSVDDGLTWLGTELGPAAGRWAWRTWRITVPAPAGPLRVTARARDLTGATHPSSPAALWNPAGYANNAWARVQLTVR